jgi:hypothetical protein
MTRIAILILVHKNEEQVNRLIKHLSKDFDIYVHIDKRSSVNIIKAENVFVYKKYKAYYCSFNIVKATLVLLKNAYKKNYDRYILISGQDLPIKTNDQIKHFFKNNNNEYVHNEKVPTTFWEGRGFEHVNRYYPNILSREKESKFLKAIDNINTKFFNFIATIIKRPIDYTFYGGSQWFRISNNCVKEIFNFIEHDKKYLKRYEHTHDSDEMFFQTIICNVKGLKIISDPLCYMDWSLPKERKRTFIEEDHGRIIKSNALFARKFDPDMDKKIIDLIYKDINEIV